MKNKKLAYFLMRIIIGVSMFGHGLVRVPKIDAFSLEMAGKFKTSIIPEFLVYPFGYVITIAEFVLGVLLILGWFTKQSLVAGIILITILVFGSTTVENFGVIDSQLFHAVVFAFLLWNLDYNYLGVDCSKKL